MMVKSAQRNSHIDTWYINNMNQLFSMLIIWKHVEYIHREIMVGRESLRQDARTEWSTAACDSWVAQLGETDNPQCVGADKTATFLLRRLKITSPGAFSSPLCTSCSCCPSKWLSLSSCLSFYFHNPCVHYILHPVHIGLFFKCSLRVTGHGQCTSGKSGSDAVSRTLH